MKKIVITFFVIGFSTTSFAAKISLETAGLCYEATRQSTKMAMLLDPDAAEYKHIINRLTGEAVDWFIADQGGTSYQCHLEKRKI